MPRVGRHRTALSVEPGRAIAPDDIQARLLGPARSMRSREVSAKASVSIRSARKFWQALGLPNADEQDPVFTEADLVALQSVAALVRDGVFDEPTALEMTRAFARTADHLAVRQVQLIAEAIGREAPRDATRPVQEDEASGFFGGSVAGSGLQGNGAMPDPATARAAAAQLADIADDLEPLLIYAWRRHLWAAITRMVTDDTGSGQREIGDDDTRDHDTRDHDTRDDDTRDDDTRDDDTRDDDTRDDDTRDDDTRDDDEQTWAHG